MRLASDLIGIPEKGAPSATLPVSTNPICDGQAQFLDDPFRLARRRSTFRRTTS
jgi:hypothetical protein